MAACKAFVNGPARGFFAVLSLGRGVEEKLESVYLGLGGNKSNKQKHKWQGEWCKARDTIKKKTQNF